MGELAQAGRRVGDADLGKEIQVLEDQLAVNQEALDELEEKLQANIAARQRLDQPTPAQIAEFQAERMWEGAAGELHDRPCPLAKLCHCERGLIKLCMTVNIPILGSSISAHLSRCRVLTHWGSWWAFEAANY